MSHEYGEKAVFLRVLGDLEVEVNGDPVSLGGPQQRLVLALLIACAPQPVTTEQLEHDVWPDSPPRTSRRTIQVYISSLRAVIGDSDVISSTRRGYRVDLERVALDSELVKLRLDVARKRLSAEPALAGMLAEEALNMWRGQAYEDQRDHERLRPEVHRLDELHNLLRETWLSARLASGETESVIPDLEAFCALHPLREKAHGLLMSALKAAGRTSDALAVYRNVQRTLAVELGVEPSTELQLIEARIVEEETSPGGEDAVPGVLSRRGLPHYLSTFIGRRSEIEEVRGLLQKHRMVTLLGPGGTGKTRLAVASVDDLAQFDVTFVDLTGVGAKSDVMSAIAFAAQVEASASFSDTEAVIGALSEGERLLFLDNCEHVAENVASAAEVLLSSSPGLRILSTSRIALGSQAEVVYAVPPMSLPGGDGHTESDAVALFTDRWSTRRPGIQLTDDNAQAVDQICRRLDGLPLALELAASRTDILTPRQIEERLDSDLRLLSDRRRSGRHAALGSAFAWSLSFLDEAQMLLLQRMSVFRSPFDLEAVEQVCGHGELARVDIIDLIGSLADQSMIQVTAGEDGHMAYRLLVPIRETLESQLDDSSMQRLRDRHLDYFRSMISNRRGSGPLLTGRAIRDDVNHALEHAFDCGRVDVAAEMVANLQTWWSVVGLRDDSLMWSRRLVDDLDCLPAESQANAIHTRAGALFHVQRLHESLQLVERLVELRSRLGDRRALAKSLSAAAILLFRLDRLDEAEQAATRASDLLEEAKSIQNDRADPTVELVVNNRARIIGHAGRTGEALQLLQPLIDMSRRRGPDVQTALVLYHESELLLLDGDPSKAAAVAREAMEMSQDLELPHLEWSARLYYVHALCDLGEMSRARAAAQPLVREAAAVGEVAEALLVAGRAIEDDASAIQVLGATWRMMDHSEVAERWARRRLERSLSERRERLPRHLVELHLERGRATPGPRAILLTDMALEQPSG